MQISPASRHQEAKTQEDEPTKQVVFKQDPSLPEGQIKKSAQDGPAGVELTCISVGSKEVDDHNDKDMSDPIRYP